MTSDRLARLTDGTFIRNWTRLFGEPPAALLNDRREMLDIAVATVPVLRNPLESRAAPLPSRDRSSGSDAKTG